MLPILSDSKDSIQKSTILTFILAAISNETISSPTAAAGRGSSELWVRAGVRCWGGVGGHLGGVVIAVVGCMEGCGSGNRGVLQRRGISP